MRYWLGLIPILGLGLTAPLTLTQTLVNTPSVEICGTSKTIDGSVVNRITLLSFFE